MEIRRQTTYHNPMIGRTHSTTVEEHVLSDEERHNQQLDTASRIVAAAITIINGLLLLRVLLALLAAPRTGFSGFVFNVTEPIVAPFYGIFPNTAATAAAGSTLDVAAIIAMVVVALIGWAISAVIDSFYRPLESDLY